MSSQPPADQSTIQPADDGWWSPPPGPAAADALPLPPDSVPAPAAGGPPQLPPADWAGFVAPPPVPPTPAPTVAESPSPPEPAEPARRWRVPVEIDDEYLAAPGSDPGFYTPRHRPSDQPQPPPTPRVETISDRSDAGDRVDPVSVPVWAVRAPGPIPATTPDGPHFIGDLSLDPMSLRRRATLRAGASAVIVDERHLRLRTWFTRTEVPWSDVHGFEAHLNTRDQTPASSGHIVALTAVGPVELPGTRRPLAELRYVHALLDAYRIRAQQIANR